MKFKLWVDDDLNNKDAPERHTPEGFVGVETSEEAIKVVQERGFENLEFMDLDHDLGLDADGNERTIKTFLKWLQETYPDGPVPSWYVHSKNVGGGAAWINSFLDSWQRSLED